MATSLTEFEKERLRAIYKELKTLSGDINDLQKMEALLKENLLIAERHGKSGNDLYQSLRQTEETQLKKAKTLPVHNKAKLQAISELKLFLMGDLLGWF